MVSKWVIAPIYPIPGGLKDLFVFTPVLGKISDSTNIFQMG